MWPARLHQRALTLTAILEHLGILCPILFRFTLGMFLLQLMSRHTFSRLPFESPTFCNNFVISWDLVHQQNFSVAGHKICAVHCWSFGLSCIFLVPAPMRCLLQEDLVVTRELTVCRTHHLGWMNMTKRSDWLKVFEFFQNLFTKSLWQSNLSTTLLS